jgi:hypothetical protein
LRLRQRPKTGVPDVLDAQEPAFLALRQNALSATGFSCSGCPASQPLRAHTGTDMPAVLIRDAGAPDGRDDRVHALSSS